jgi:hypothetical protein
MTDIYRIARGLSVPQKRSLLAFCECWRSSGKGNASGFALWGRGLAERRTRRSGGPEYRLTPLGLQVRAHLLAASPISGSPE